MTTVPRFDTEEVFDQSPPYENIDLLFERCPLMEAVQLTAPVERRRARRLRSAMGNCGHVFAGAARQREPPEALHF